MTALYVFSLVLGGSFLLLSLLGDAFGGDADLDVDGGLELDAGDAAEMADASDAVDGARGADGADASDHASRVFSIRTVIYALFGFGAVGTILSYAGAGATTTLVSSVAGGLLTGAVVTVLFGWLRSTDLPDRAPDASLIGLTGAVTLPMGPGSPGAIVVRRGQRRLTLRALPHDPDAEDAEGWTSVVVVDMERGVARVSPVEGDLALEA